MSGDTVGAVSGPSAADLAFHWQIDEAALVLVAATSICLVVAVLRLLRHAQSQDAVRKEAQALLLRAERARMDADQANADGDRDERDAAEHPRQQPTELGPRGMAPMADALR